MQKPCKFCTFSSSKRGQILKHYRLKHVGFTRTSPIRCLHQQYLRTFNSFNILKVHLSTFHSQITPVKKKKKDYKQIFNCQLWEFKEPCTEQDFLTHLRKHLKLFQRVQCPYMDYDFETNVYSTFNAHKSRNHNQRSMDASLPLKPEIVSQLSWSGESIPVLAVDDITSEDKKLQILMFRTWMPNWS